MEIWEDDSRIVYDEGKIVRLRVGNVRLEDGTLALREVVEHPGGVGVVPFTGNSVILVRQYRIAIGHEVLEIPAGKLEVQDTDTEARGRAELEEEAGYIAAQFIPVGHIYSAIGFCSERIHLFLALGLTKTKQRLEHDELIEIVEMPLNQVRTGLRHHSFKDSKTAIGLQALLYHLEDSGAGP